MSVIARVRSHPQPLTADEARAAVAEYDALLDALSETFKLLGFYRQEHDDQVADSDGFPHCACDNCERVMAAKRQQAFALQPRPGYTALSDAYQKLKVENERLLDLIADQIGLMRGFAGNVRRTADPDRGEHTLKVVQGDAEAILKGMDDLFAREFPAEAACADPT